MSERSAGGTDQSVRYSDPITERGGWVGRGTVLYDVRDATHRTCCAKDRQRHLYHITGIYEEIETGEVHVEVQDGTHTVRETIHVDDVLALFEPAGFTISVGTKPTYVLTRQHGVTDGHDLMTDGGHSAGDTDRSVLHRTPNYKCIGVVQCSTEGVKLCKSTWKNASAKVAVKRLSRRRATRASTARLSVRTDGAQNRQTPRRRLRASQRTAQGNGAFLARIHRRSGPRLGGDGSSRHPRGTRRSVALISSIFQCDGCCVEPETDRSGGDGDV